MARKTTNQAAKGNKASAKSAKQTKRGGKPAAKSARKANAEVNKGGYTRETHGQAYARKAEILGRSITSVCKWMGANNWSLEEARNVAANLADGVYQPATIVTALSDGRSGHPVYSKGMADDLTKSEIAILVRAAKAPPKARKAAKPKGKGKGRKSAA